MPDNKDQTHLYQTILNLKDIKELSAFFEDLCTPNEISSMVDRWKASQLVDQNIPYREIYEQTGISTATVTRVARSLSLGAGGYRLALDRINKKRKSSK